MAINPLNPQRVDPPADQSDPNSDWAQLCKAWQQSSKPRYFVYSKVKWMQIRDNQGVCFVPSGRDDGIDGMNSGSSFGKALGGR